MVAYFCNLCKINFDNMRNNFANISQVKYYRKKLSNLILHVVGRKMPPYFINLNRLQKIYFSNKDTNLSIRAIFLSFTFICSSWNFFSHQQQINELILPLTHFFTFSHAISVLLIVLWLLFSLSSIGLHVPFALQITLAPFLTPTDTVFKGVILGSSPITATISEWNSILLRLSQDFLFASSTALYLAIKLLNFDWHCNQSPE